MIKCSICGEIITDFGNNPYPVRLNEEDRCCNFCNDNLVLPARIILIGCKDRKKQIEVANELNTKSMLELIALFDNIFNG